MRREFRPNRPVHAQAGMAGPERAKLVADAIAKANLLLHQRMAERLLAAHPGDAEDLLDQVRGELSRMQRLGTYPRFELECWQEILDRPVAEIAAVMVSESGASGTDLRTYSPWKRAVS
jgi:hypothetical protein